VKRFYATVTVTAEREILLDNRVVRTPAKATLVLPTTALADAVAEEWRSQEGDIKPQSMPLTGLANVAIDHVIPHHEAFAQSLSLYAESDLLCYRAGEPPELLARQKAIWDPILERAERHYGVVFKTVTGIIHEKQPATTLAYFVRFVGDLDPYALAALHPLVTISGSLVIALAVVKQQLEPDAAFDAAHLDELWQAEQWGQDHFAVETRTAHRRDFLAAARFNALLHRKS
jgi:chaperone required for assembly of F1-ATPase